MRVIDLHKPLAGHVCRKRWEALFEMLCVDHVDFVSGALKWIVTGEIRKCSQCRELLHQYTSHATDRLYATMVHDAARFHDFSQHGRDI
jgi:hypothetical protein